MITNTFVDKDPNTRRNLSLELTTARPFIQRQTHEPNSGSIIINLAKAKTIPPHQKNAKQQKARSRDSLKWWRIIDIKSVTDSRRSLQQHRESLYTDVWTPSSTRVLQKFERITTMPCQHSAYTFTLKQTSDTIADDCHRI